MHIRKQLSNFESIQDPVQFSRAVLSLDFSVGDFSEKSR